MLNFPYRQSPGFCFLPLKLTYQIPSSLKRQIVKPLDILPIMCMCIYINIFLMMSLVMNEINFSKKEYIFQNITNLSRFQRKLHLLPSSSEQVNDKRSIFIAKTKFLWKNNRIEQKFNSQIVSRGKESSNFRAEDFLWNLCLWLSTGAQRNDCRCYHC